MNPCHRSLGVLAGEEHATVRRGRAGGARAARSRARTPRKPPRDHGSCSHATAWPTSRPAEVGVPQPSQEAGDVAADRADASASEPARGRRRPSRVSTAARCSSAAFPDGAARQVRSERARPAADAATTGDRSAATPWSRRPSPAPPSAARWRAGQRRIEGARHGRAAAEARRWRTPRAILVHPAARRPPTATRTPPACPAAIVAHRGAQVDAAAPAHGAAASASISRSLPPMMRERCRAARWLAAERAARSAPGPTARRARRRRSHAAIRPRRGHTPAWCRAARAASTLRRADRRRDRGVGTWRRRRDTRRRTSAGDARGLATAGRRSGWRVVRRPSSRASPKPAAKDARQRQTQSEPPARGWPRAADR